MAEPAGRRAYLLASVGLDPAEHAGRILELRRSHRSGGALASRESARPTRRAAPDRGPVEAELERIAEALFEDAPAALAERLATLALDDFPDLARRRARLDAVLAARADIDAASASPKTDPRFFEAVLRILAAPQREAAEIKRRTLSGMRSGLHRKKARATLLAWRKGQPRLFALEAEWFGKVLQAKSILKSHKKPAAVGFFFIAYFLIKLILMLVRG